jgi:hypothetical protein
MYLNRSFFEGKRFLWSGHGYHVVKVYIYFFIICLWYNDLLNSGLGFSTKSLQSVCYFLVGVVLIEHRLYKPYQRLEGRPSMATLNFIRGSIKGRVGQFVGSSWRGKDYIKTFTPPSNPQDCGAGSSKDDFSTRRPYCKSDL